jgi:quercetin dioxygenase-like cupin family protein
MSGPQSVPRPEWSRLPLDGAVGIEVKVLLPPPSQIAMLRFSANAGFPAHAAPFDVDVVCLEGDGFVQVGERVYPFQAGEQIRWPANLLHRLWTASEPMTTLMVERGTWDDAT